MKIFLRRVPFFTQQLLGWAYLVFWVLKIVSPEIQVQLSHLPRLVYDLLLFVTLNAFIQVLSALRRRKKATQFLSTLPSQFYETVHTLSAMPIAYLSSAKSRRRPTAVRVGGMFVQPAQQACAENIQTAAELAAQLRNALQERENKLYADYSEPPQVDFSFWNLGVDVYRIKIRSSDLNSYTELYYSPLGKTKALKERTWFPPVELAPAWFV